MLKCHKLAVLFLHMRANQVTFDAAKESKHILRLWEPAGTTFKLLGALFDDGSEMNAAIVPLVSDATWKLRPLLHARLRTAPYASHLSCNQGLT